MPTKFPLLKILFKGDVPLKYHLKNSLLNKLRFQFPEQQMLDFFGKLPSTKHADNKYLNLKDKIAIMTFDDEFDEEIYRYEKEVHARSTFFLLSYKLRKKIAKPGLDLQLHFDKRYSQINKQIGQFKKFVAKNPIANRNHTLWWKHNHHDLLYLAMNGIKIDSSLVGIKPFRLCVQGKILPIWEVPFNVCDSPNVLSAPYSTARDMKSLFVRKVTPIVGLFHPYLKHRSDWKDFYKYADKHNYKMMTLAEFYNVYLRGR